MSNENKVTGEHAPIQASALNTILNAPNPREYYSGKDHKLNNRAAQLPEKYRSTFNGICKVEREALLELKFNQDAKRDELIEAERIDNLQCMVAPTTEHPVKRPVTESIQQKIIDAARQWVSGLEAGQHSAVAEYFYSMKKSYLDHAEKLHRNWQRTVKRTRSNKHCR